MALWLAGLPSEPFYLPLDSACLSSGSHYDIGRQRFIFLRNDKDHRIESLMHGAMKSMRLGINYTYVILHATRPTIHWPNVSPP